MNNFFKIFDCILSSESCIILMLEWHKLSSIVMLIASLTINMIMIVSSLLILLLLSTCVPRTPSPYMLLTDTIEMVNDIK